MKKTETQNQPQPKEKPRLLFLFPDILGNGADKHAEVSLIHSLLNISGIPYESSFSSEIKEPEVLTHPFYGRGDIGIEEITDTLKQMLKDPELAKKAAYPELKEGNLWFDINIVLKELAGDDPRNFTIANKHRRKYGWSHERCAESEAKHSHPACAATHLLLAKNLSPKRKIKILSLAWENAAKKNRELAEKYQRLDLTSSVEALSQRATIQEAWATVIKSYILR